MPVEPDQGRPDGEDADDKDWLDDVIWPAETEQGVPWAGAVGPAQAGPAAGQRPPRRPGPLVSLIVVAVLAAGAGAGLTFALNGSSGTPAAVTSTPSPGRASGAVPGGGAGGPVSQMLVIGTVTAVSGTSITIGGNGPPVTAAVTDSTRVTGRVSGIGGIKVGDQVSAQLTQRGGQIVATAIQYPARQSAGGIP